MNEFVIIIGGRLTVTLYAGQHHTISVAPPNLDTLVFLFPMLVVGGLGTCWGPLIGAIIMVVLDEPMKDFGEWRRTQCRLERGMAGGSDDRNQARPLPPDGNRGGPIDWRPDAAR